MHYDTTRFVSAAMRDVVVTLVEALLLVVAVVFIFLQSWRTTIIPTIAIPVSLIATLVVMKLLGFSLNMLSLLGMVLAIGLVVDDAIVVVENVERQLENGKKPLEAARAAMKEVTGPIIATTAVLMAVFVPVAFIPGVTGSLYNQFALTVAISFGISAFNSLTLTPALSAAFLRHRGETKFPPFRWFNQRLRLARAQLCQRRAHAGAVALGGTRVFVATLGATYLVSTRIPSTFLPVEDQGYFFVVIQLPDGASLERTDAVAKQVRDILQNTPGVDIVGSISGLNFLTNAAQSNSAVEFAILKPWDERPPSQNASKIVASVRPKLLSIPGAFALSFDPPSIPGLGATGGFRISGRGFERPRKFCAQRRGAGGDRRSAQAAGNQPATTILGVQHLDAAVQLRPRSQQGQAPGSYAAGRVQYAADLSRLALRERLQPVRTHIPRNPSGREGRARELRPICRDCTFAMQKAA